MVCQRSAGRTAETMRGLHGGGLRRTDRVAATSCVWLGFNDRRVDEHQSWAYGVRNVLLQPLGYRIGLLDEVCLKGRRRTPPNLIDCGAPTPVACGSH